MYIYAHNAGSEGAKLLKEAMGIQRIKNENSKFRGSPNKVVINWGSSALPPEVLKSTVLNRPDRVTEAINKLSFFRKVSRVNTGYVPAWTDNTNTALEWLGQGSVVCARTILNGSSANGLVVMEPKHPEGFVRAPLYTLYIPKEEEYRVHVVRGRVIDVQRKTLKKDFADEKAKKGEAINWRIRNLENGFIYQRENVNPKDSILNLAVAVVQACELDFGAVDIVVHRKSGLPYALEVNTAPGIQGTTVENYARALR